MFLFFFSSGVADCRVLHAFVYVAEEYEAWDRRYREALSELENRDAEISRVSGEIEHDLILLGATAIEDKLQDGVPETIADLKRAGIKIWVATGDRLETAIGPSSIIPYSRLYRAY